MKPAPTRALAKHVARGRRSSFLVAIKAIVILTSLVGFGVALGYSIAGAILGWK